MASWQTLYEGCMSLWLTRYMDRSSYDVGAQQESKKSPARWEHIRKAKEVAGRSSCAQDEWAWSNVGKP